MHLHHCIEYYPMQIILTLAVTQAFISGIGKIGPRVWAWHVITFVRAKAEVGVFVPRRSVLALFTTRTALRGEFTGLDIILPGAK